MLPQNPIRYNPGFHSYLNPGLATGHKVKGGGKTGFEGALFLLAQH
jgi:hypothetical protein